MPYKIVSVDENSKFPARLEARLESDFASLGPDGQVLPEQLADVVVTPPLIGDTSDPGTYIRPSDSSLVPDPNDPGTFIPVGGPADVYKPVGVSSTGLFPSRVETRLAGQFAPKDSSYTKADSDARYIRSTPTAQQVTAGAPGSFTLPKIEVMWVTLGASVTFVMPTAEIGFGSIIYLVQDATGTRTVTWPSTVKWPTLGAAPVLNMNANTTNAVVVIKQPNGEWWGYPIQ